MQNIHDVIRLIPEDSRDEALFAIETITAFPAQSKARIRVYPMNEFRLVVSLKNDVIHIDAEGRNSVCCTEASFLSQLRRVIYTVDEEMSNGRYQQNPPKERLIFDMPAPPADMDIPVWDEGKSQWCDAEY